jgi:hypothetical protein
MMARVRRALVGIVVGIGLSAGTAHAQTEDIAAQLRAVPG